MVHQYRLVLLGRENIVHLRLIVVLFVDDRDLRQNRGINFVVRHYLRLQAVAEHADEGLEGDELLAGGLAILRL